MAGIILPSIPWAEYSGLSSTVVAGVAPQPNDSDYPYMVAPEGCVHGPMTDNGPIDVVSWEGSGVMAPDGYLEWWQQCLTLFMRHI